MPAYFLHVASINVGATTGSVDLCRVSSGCLGGCKCIKNTDKDGQNLRDNADFCALKAELPIMF